MDVVDHHPCASKLQRWLWEHFSNLTMLQGATKTRLVHKLARHSRMIRKDDVVILIISIPAQDPYGTYTLDNNNNNKSPCCFVSYYSSIGRQGCHHKSWDKKLSLGTFDPGYYISVFLPGFPSPEVDFSPPFSNTKLTFLLKRLDGCLPSIRPF